MYGWLKNTGNPFLSSSNTIGRSENDSSYLLCSHESFEESTSDTYALVNRLRELTVRLASSKDCEPEAIMKEEQALQGAVDRFSSQMSARRDIIVHAKDYFMKLREVGVNLVIYN